MPACSNQQLAMTIHPADAAAYVLCTEFFEVLSVDPHGLVSMPPSTEGERGPLSDVALALFNTAQGRPLFDQVLTIVRHAAVHDDAALHVLRSLGALYACAFVAELIEQGAIDVH